MTDEKKKRMCPDPDCKTENDAELQFCSKCNLDLDGFNLIDRALSVREKRDKAAKEEADKNKPTPVRKGLSALAGRNRK